MQVVVSMMIACEEGGGGGYWDKSLLAGGMRTNEVVAIAGMQEERETSSCPCGRKHSDGLESHGEKTSPHMNK